MILPSSNVLKGDNLPSFPLITNFFKSISSKDFCLFSFNNERLYYHFQKEKKIHKSVNKKQTTFLRCIIPQPSSLCGTNTLRCTGHQNKIRNSLKIENKNNKINIQEPLSSHIIFLNFFFYQNTFKLGLVEHGKQKWKNNIVWSFWQLLYLWSLV